MSPSQLTSFLGFGIQNNLNILIKGKPGIGKSDLVAQACDIAKARLIISHPVVSDPTDYKGLPFPDKDGNHAKFLPFGELQELIEAKEPTVFFLDDLGQAPVSVQAAVMQLLLARRVNGHKVSDHVTFVAATNRREDKAGVQGLLEPVKSRFASIVELNVQHDDWVKWAIEHNMPTTLIAYVRHDPKVLDEAEPTKDIINSPSPRTIAAVGRMQNAGLPEKLYSEAFKGAAGQAFATKYMAFLKVYGKLPTIDEIKMNPDQASIPQAADAKWALAGMMAAHMNENNISSLCKYIKRLPGELGVATFKDVVVRDNMNGKKLQQTKAFITWASENADVLL
jgi:hypothetical protein